MSNTPLYLSVKFDDAGYPVSVQTFFDAETMDDFSRSCTDKKTFIYRLGTDFLIDGHTEGARLP